MALQYAQRGLAVFPVKEKDKTPLTKNGCKDAIKDAETIQRWWSQIPHANIGIATGEPSGLWVLDIDGEEGEDSLKALEAAHGALPHTMEAHTGGGGRHLYFALPQGLEISNSAGKVGFKIDVRGNGGYVVAPPSIHKSGRKYAWSVDSADNMAMAPEWLLKMIVLAAKPSEFCQTDFLNELGDIPEGRRNDTLTRLTGKLLSHGLGGRLVLWIMIAINKGYCVPPLHASELFKIFYSIARREVFKRGAF